MNSVIIREGVLRKWGNFIVTHTSLQNPLKRKTFSFPSKFLNFEPNEREESFYGTMEFFSSISFSAIRNR